VVRAAVVLALCLGGCAVFDDPPDRACTKDNECFQAQGETCNLDTKQCEVVEPDAMPARWDPDDDPDDDELASEVAP